MPRRRQLSAFSSSLLCEKCTHTADCIALFAIVPQRLHTVSTLLLTIHKAAHLGQARSHFQQHSTLFNSLLFDLQSDIHSVHITKHLPFPYTMVFRLDNKKDCNDCNEMCLCSILASSSCTTTLDCVESFVASDIFISSSLSFSSSKSLDSA